MKNPKIQDFKFDLQFITHLLNRTRVEFTPQEIKIFQRRLKNYIIPALAILDQIPLDKKESDYWPIIPLSTKLRSTQPSPKQKNLFELNKRPLTKEKLFLIKNVRSNLEKNDD